ncbi:DUF1638 domain-containing protein [Thalassovita sp.]|jgi:hypothetical protein|uniref:DUF1638 domain-containing protein n=1 Tax=Thalassovita sp. TaxID=1979401 RepID=UPI003B5CF321
MSLPDDQSLTTQGLAPAQASGRVLIIACGALAHEILALIRLNGWSHMDLTCLPAILHNHPERIADAVDQAINKHRHTHDHLFVAYADCGTGGALQQVCDRHNVQMIAGPHCYAFFEGLDQFAGHQDEITAFYLTDFLTRQFDAFVWKPLGLDRHPDLRDMYFGHYTKLVYQAQTDDPQLTAKAQDCALRLGLQFERRFTGYGDLSTALANQA